MGMRVTGKCHVLFAFDVGFEIDLEGVETRLASPSQRAKFRHRRRVSTGEGSGVPPLRFTEESPPVQLGPHRTEGAITLTVYEFGAVCITYAIPLDHDLEALVGMSALLYDNEILLEQSRRRVREILEVIRGSVEKPEVAAVLEDYIIYHLDPSGVPVDELCERHPETLARILRAEEGPLSEEEIRDSLGNRISYRPGEVVVTDWLAALVVGKEMEDELGVLQLITIELVELRSLDARLEAGLDRAYVALSRARSALVGLAPRSRELERIGLMQADNAVLLEGVDNALKLLGDDYLARLYRVASERFHVSGWESSIQRKLQTLQSIYSQLSDMAHRRRAEILEWIIIVLIAIEILAYFESQGWLRWLLG
jgi:hypothetical protein